MSSIKDWPAQCKLHKARGICLMPTVAILTANFRDFLWLLFYMYLAKYRILLNNICIWWRSMFRIRYGRMNAQFPGLCWNLELNLWVWHDNRNYWIRQPTWLHWLLGKIYWCMPILETILVQALSNSTQLVEWLGQYKLFIVHVFVGLLDFEWPARWLTEQN